MRRRFTQHRSRQVDHLEGLWDFAFLGNRDPDAVDPARIRYTEVAAVPGCFDATPRHAGRRGLAAYRTRVSFRDTAHHRLFLDGVHHWCRVFLNGKPLGEHAGGFTRFHFDIHPAAAGEAELAVLVDNRFDAGRSPLHLPEYDWYHFGGICRGAELHRLGGCWIDSLRIATADYRARRIHVAARIFNAGEAQQLPLQAYVDDGSVRSETVSLSRGPNSIGFSVDLPGASLWSPSTPSLHLLRLEVGDDDMVERFGVRQVEVQGRRLLLNGEPLRLLGFCRHESHSQFGHALPDQLLVADIQILRELGCNFVRGAHYPQDPRFLDLCDEAGLCVWSEGTAWGNGPAQLSDPRFVDAALQNLEEMVSTGFNHPSVILWGVFNEGASHLAECRPAYEKALGRLRELDASRPVTYACNRPQRDLCRDLADIISVNFYPGWYEGELSGIPERIDRLFQSLDEAGEADKPLLISEIGAAALYGCHDWNGQRWTEEYQARLLTRAIEHLFGEHERVCGVSIWQFCDTRTTELITRTLSRPRSFNNKGVLDEYRRPKLAFGAVKRAFARAAGHRR